MARIKQADGNLHSNYNLLFGNQDLGYLISQVHSATISMGTQLGAMVSAVIPEERITTLENIQEGLQVHDLEVVPRPVKKRFTDYAVFKHSEGLVYAIKFVLAKQYDQLKGREIRIRNEEVLAQVVSETGYHQGRSIICGFLASTIDEVIQCMLDPDLDESDVWTGRDFCRFLDIDYEEAMAHISRDQEANCQYFFDAVAGIRMGMSIVPKEGQG